MNKHLKKVLINIINETIKKEARKEAFLILKKANNKIISDFLFNYHCKKYNILCMILDFTKWNLINDKKIKKSKKDYFGGTQYDRIK